MPEGIGLGDYHSFHSSRDGIESVLNLGNHATGNSAVGNIAIEIIACDNRDDTIVVVGIRQYALLLEAESEGDVIIGSKSLGCFASDGVGIGVEDIALSVVGKRSHHGGDTSLDECGEHTSVGLIHIAHKTIVNAILQRALMRADDIHVGTRQTEGIHSHSLKLGHHILVDKTAIHHSNHFEHVGISDTTSIHHLGLNTEFCGYLGGTTSTTMHQHLLALNRREVGKKTGQLRFIFDNCPSYLNYIYGVFLHIHIIYTKITCENVTLLPVTSSTIQDMYIHKAPNDNWRGTPCPPQV